MGYSKANFQINAAHPIRFIRTEFIHVRCVDDEETPFAGRKYKLELPNGDVIEGVLDDDGWAREDQVLPGECTFTLFEPEIRVLKMRMKDEENEDMSGLPYELTCGSNTFSGTTDQEGRLQAEIPEGSEDGTLKLWLEGDKSGEPYSWPIKISDHTV